MTKKNNPDSIEPITNDYISSAIKAIAGAVPFAGSLLVEIAGHLIPNQRIDRIADFAKKLDKHLSKLEEDFIRSQLSDENFTDLIEEGIRQAARSLSEIRRDYISSIISNGLSQDHINYIESKHLMEILGELNDIEIVWLRYYLVPGYTGDEEFRQKHKEILEPIMGHHNDPPHVFDQLSIQRSYTQHLVRLGLLQPEYKKNRDNSPVFNDFTGSQEIQRYEITLLGKMLLRYIGFEKEFWLE